MNEKIDFVKLEKELNGIDFNIDLNDDFGMMNYGGVDEVDFDFLPFELKTNNTDYLITL